MELSEEREALLLAYCKLQELAEDPEVQETIPALWRSAASYMAQAGVSEPPEGTPRRAQYDLIVNAMVLSAWDKRERVVTGTVVTENPAFRTMMSQLVLTEPDVSDSDTGGM